MLLLLQYRAESLQSEKEVSQSSAEKIMFVEFYFNVILHLR